MEFAIPDIIEMLYYGMVSEPDPNRWPEHLKKNPIHGHGIWSFYSGLRMGLQLAIACLDHD